MILTKIILVVAFLATAFVLRKKKGLKKPLVAFLVLSAAAIVASIWVYLNTLWLVIDIAAWLTAAAIVILACLLGLRRVAGWTVAVLAAVIVISGFAGTTAPTPEQNSPAVSSSPSSTPQTWKMETGNYANNRWFGDGIQEIKDAKTEEDAKAASLAWLERVKTDPNLLTGTAKYFLNRDVDKASLVKDGWATDEAVQLVAELQLALAQAETSIGEAPKNGYNSGVYNGKVVAASNAGITGSRKAIKVTLKDGSVIYVMARCGNPVTPGKPSLPEGPTDENPKPTPTLVPTPTLAPKIIGDAPQRQGNLPTQQVPNPLPAQSSHKQPTKPPAPPATYTPPVKPPPSAAASLKPVKTAKPSTRPTATPVMVDPVQTHGPVNPPSW